MSTTSTKLLCRRPCHCSRSKASPEFWMHRALQLRFCLSLLLLIVAVVSAETTTTTRTAITTLTTTTEMITARRKNAFCHWPATSSSSPLGAAAWISPRLRHTTRSNSEAVAQKPVIGSTTQKQQLLLHQKRQEQQSQSKHGWYYAGRSPLWMTATVPTSSGCGQSSNSFFQQRRQQQRHHQQQQRRLMWESSWSFSSSSSSLALYRGGSLNNEDSGSEPTRFMSSSSSSSTSSPSSSVSKQPSAAFASSASRTSALEMAPASSSAETSNNNNEKIESATSSSSSSSSSVLTETSSTNNNKDDELQKQRLQLYYEQAFRLGGDDDDLPLQTFGGLPYWNTTHHGKFRVVFILGGPGAGKGTQSALMAENYPNVVHLSVGQLLREEQSKPNSPHRELIEQALVSGSIVPVEISLALVKQAMQQATTTTTRPGGASEDKNNNNSKKDVLFLIDGFPRNDDNLAGWGQYMGNVAAVWAVLFYTCPLQVLEQRLLDRAQNSGRSDDNLKSIHKRFATFEQETVPIIRQLQALSKMSSSSTSTGTPFSRPRPQWCVWEIAGDQTLDQVWLATQHALNQLIRHDVLTANAQLLQAVEQGDSLAYQELCDPLWFANHSSTTTEQSSLAGGESANDDDDEDSLATARAVMEQYEGKPIDENNRNILSCLSDAELEFISGQHVAVSYTRPLGRQLVREKRLWVYNNKNSEHGEHGPSDITSIISHHSGWRNVHFSRTPVMPDQPN